MNNTIQYKGYIGSVEFSEDDAIFYGKVLGIRSLISYEGDNATDLINDFHEAVDDYLELCKQQGRKPEIAFKGSFNVRISPDLHRKVFVYATTHQMSMNRYIEETLENRLLPRNRVKKYIPLAKKHLTTNLPSAFYL